jgi:hypothetical protein
MALDMAAKRPPVKEIAVFERFLRVSRHYRRAEVDSQKPV